MTSLTGHRIISYPNPNETGEIHLDSRDIAMSSHRGYFSLNERGWTPPKTISARARIEKGYSPDVVDTR
jgi:hypothetical protein